MDDASLDKLLDRAWEDMPQELKDKAIRHLHDSYATQFFDEIRRRHAKYGKEWMPDYFHHLQGMEVRNTLRDVIRDAELPSLDAYYGEGTNARNWDDYYIQALEAAAGLR